VRRLKFEVGIENGGKFFRRVVDDIQSVINKYNGIANLFYNPYKFSNQINYFIFDLDGVTSYEDNNALCEYFSDFQHVHVFSGRKGFHFYLKIKPIPLNEMTKLYFMGFINYMRDELQLKSWDYNTSIRLATGNGLIRIPNTIHLNGRYCTYVPCRADFNTILKDSEHPNPLIVHHGKEYDITVYVDYSRKVKDVSFEVTSYKIDDVELSTVSEIVRPCVFRQAYAKKPDHFIRTQFALELIYLGYDVESVVNILRKMGWENFDYNISKYHVIKLYEKVKQKKLFPASCSVLKQRRIGCNTCEYHNWWYD